MKLHTYRKEIFRFLFLFLILFIFKSNNNIKSKNISNTNISAYEYWEKMMLRDSVDYQMIMSSFNNSETENESTESTTERFNNWLLYNETYSDKYIYSDITKFSYLQNFRTKAGIIDEQKMSKAKFPSEYVLSIPNSNSLGQWQNIGPFGNPDIHWEATGNGAIEYIRMHPSKPNIMYVCSANGGLWKTINYAKTWEAQTDYFYTNNTSCIDISQTSNNTMYLGTAEDQQVWFTQNAGQTWTNRSIGLSGNIFDIAIDPVDPDKVILASSEGVFYTENAGVLWEKKINGFFTDLDYTKKWEMIIVSNDLDNIDPVFYFSINKGKDFIQQEIISHLDKVDKFYMAIHQYKNSDIEVFAYGLLNSNKPTRFIGLYKSYYNSSSNQAFNFKQVKHSMYTYPNGSVPLFMNKGIINEESTDSDGSINPESRAKWINDFYVSPRYSNRMISMNAKFWASEDGGMIWEKKPSYEQKTWADNRYITTNISQDTIFWCNTGGIWCIKEDDLFPSDQDIQQSGLDKLEYINTKIVSKNGNICVSQATQLDISLINKDVFISGGEGVGQIFNRNGRTTHVASYNVYKGRLKPNDDSKFITGALEINLNGKTDKYSVYNNIEADNFDADRIYAFTNMNITRNKEEILLVRSKKNTDAWQVNSFIGEQYANKGGHSWQAKFPDWEIVNISDTKIVKLNPNAFKQSRANANLAFLADEESSKVFICENLSSSQAVWSELINAPHAKHFRFATCSKNENFIVLATDLGIFVSKDKGQSWIRRANIPEKYPISVLIDKDVSEGIYVLGELTVYYIDESFSQWQEFNKGLPLQNCTDMRIAYYPNSDSRLYVSKFGRGVWVSPLHSSNKETQKPIADFSVYGNENTIISKGEFVSFKNLSLNAESITWTFTNDNESIEIINKDIVSVPFNYTGYYTVSLTATKDGTSSTITKEQYIKVKSSKTELICNSINTSNLPRDRGMKAVRIQGDTYYLPSRNIHVTDNHIFTIVEGESVSVFINNLSLLHRFFTNVYIDFNNDGDFDDDNELIASSETRKLQFTSFFNIPDDAILNQDLNLRIVGVESDMAPVSCMENGIFQILDLSIHIKSKPVIFNSYSEDITYNSASLSTSFTNADKVDKYGFVYSSIDADLNIYNSNITQTTSILSDNDKYTIQINSLDYNKTYYYKAFLIDENGIHYGQKETFVLENYNTPSAEALLAINTDTNNWILKSIIYPQNNTIDELYIQYGINNFDYEIQVSNYNSTAKFNVTKSVEITEPGAYNFRIKMIVGQQVYYSNSIAFETDKKYCQPIIANSPWYKRISEFTLNGISNTSDNDDPYTFFPDVIFNLYSGQEYPVRIVDSYNLSYHLKYLIYVDFNNDGDFDDYHEKILDQDPQESFCDAIIHIPNENVVYNQLLRLRVVAYDGGIAGACLITENGQIEDYQIIVTPTAYDASVRTLSVDNVKITSARANIELLDFGYPKVFSIGVCWSENELPTKNDNIMEQQIDIGVSLMSFDILNLNPNTHYYIRSFAESESGIVYGEQFDFNTLLGAEMLISNLIININKDENNVSYIKMKLSMKPDDEVVISISNDNPIELILDKFEFIFDSENWFIEQNVKIKITDDIVPLPRLMATIDFTVIDNVSDLLYQNLETKSVVINIKGVDGIDDLDSGNVYIFPNPTRGKIYISGLVPAKITICNMSGLKLIYKENVSYVDLSGLGNGVYLAYIITNNGIGYVKKIIVDLH